MSEETSRFYEFGPIRLDSGRQLLLRDGQPVPLTSKAFETLLALVQRGDQLVSKDELMKQLWPDTFVEESNLTQHISMLRKALGESPQDHLYTVTMSATVIVSSGSSFGMTARLTLIERTKAFRTFAPCISGITFK